MIDKKTFSNTNMLKTSQWNFALRTQIIFPTNTCFESKIIISV